MTDLHKRVVVGNTLTPTERQRVQEYLTPPPKRWPNLEEVLARHGLVGEEFDDTRDSEYLLPFDQLAACLLDLGWTCLFDQTRRLQPCHQDEPNLWHNKRHQHWSHPLGMLLNVQSETEQQDSSFAEPTQAYNFMLSIVTERRQGRLGFALSQDELRGFSMRSGLLTPTGRNGALMTFNGAVNKIPTLLQDINSAGRPVGFDEWEREDAFPMRVEFGDHLPLGQTMPLAAKIEHAWDSIATLLQTAQAHPGLDKLLQEAILQSLGYHQAASLRQEPAFLDHAPSWAKPTLLALNDPRSQASGHRGRWFDYEAMMDHETSLNDQHRLHPYHDPTTSALLCNWAKKVCWQEPSSLDWSSVIMDQRTQNGMSLGEAVAVSCMSTSSIKSEQWTQIWTSLLDNTPPSLLEQWCTQPNAVGQTLPMAIVGQCLNMERDPATQQARALVLLQDLQARLPVHHHGLQTATLTLPGMWWQKFLAWSSAHPMSAQRDQEEDSPHALLPWSQWKNLLQDLQDQQWSVDPTVVFPRTLVCVQPHYAAQITIDTLPAHHTTVPHLIDTVPMRPTVLQDVMATEVISALPDKPRKFLKM